MSIILLALLGAGQSVNAQSSKTTTKPDMPQTVVDWQQTAVKDINDAYQMTLENHPGSYDPQNPDFLTAINLAKEQALVLASKVKNADGYRATIMKFNTLIHDGHAGIHPKLAPELLSGNLWPGFVSVWRDDGLYIYASENTALPVGAKVITCDGLAIKEVISRNVFGFQGRINEPGHWWYKARKVFEGDSNPFITLPKQCQFSLSGKKFEHRLKWQPSTKQADKWRMESYNGDKWPVGLTEPREKLYWAAMPSFQPDEKERKSYRRMTAEVKNNRQTYLDADALVIDLRHNQGGSSQWSRDFAAALWGEAAVTRHMNAYSAKTQVWWRASKGNTEHMTGVVDMLTKQKQTSMIDWAKENSTGMQAALARGDIFYKESTADEAKLTEPLNGDLPNNQPAFTKPVYIIVPGQCASACLDALDVFTRFSNSKLIGAPSAADSTYMDIRLQKLDSGLAYVIIPNKVYINRPRANGQGYLPDIYVNDLEWSQKNFLAVVENDLAQRKR